MTNGFDFGAGADQNTILGVANVSVTNPFIDNDGKTIYVPDFDRGAARFPAGVSTRHMAGTTPTGGVSGEVRVGTNKIWVNDAGTWKSATVA
jgi:hypothetical protein